MYSLMPQYILEIRDKVIKLSINFQLDFSHVMNIIDCLKSHGTIITVAERPGDSPRGERVSILASRHHQNMIV